MADYSTLSLCSTDEIEYLVFERLESTNDHLLAQPPSDKTQVCVTAMQTAGKGQYGRAWVSSQDSSILLSVRRAFPVSRALNGLSLVAGLSLIKVLGELGVTGAQLKWPNDVYVDNKKLAGILIENSVQGQAQYPVIGIGLNNHLQTAEIDKPWTDLFSLLGQAQDAPAMVQRIAKQLTQDCAQFEDQGFEPFRSAYQTCDYLLGRELRLDYQDQTLVGVASGIDVEGALLLTHAGQVIKVYSSEQITLI